MSRRGKGTGRQANRTNEAQMLKMVASMHHAQGKQELAVHEAMEVLAMQRASGNGYLHHIYDLLAEIQGQKVLLSGSFAVRF
jgi:hypothetical protein